MEKLKAYADLLRLHAPTGYMLLLYPCLFGLGLSITELSQLRYALLFFVGSLVMRSSGCIINDIFDRNIDCRVDRTKNRPLATRILSIKEALAALVILMLIGLAILCTLPRLAIIIGILTVPLITIYPLMKRITYFPQAVLGMSFGGAGVLIAYASITNTVSLPTILMYIGCIFWTLGYDGIYAFMDMDDDKKIGVKSIALFLRDLNYKAWLMCFYMIFILLFLCSAFLVKCNFYILPFVLAGLIMLKWQVWTLDIKSRENCMERFKNNNYVGLIISIGLIICKLGT